MGENLLLYIYGDENSLTFDPDKYIWTIDPKQNKIYLAFQNFFFFFNYLSTSPNSQQRVIMDLATKQNKSNSIYIVQSQIK